MLQSDFKQEPKIMNNYIITGSIGHISKPIIEALVSAGKEVSVVTSSPGRVSEIEAFGAKALVGEVQNESFVNLAFSDADVVYTMIPPIWQTSDWKKSQLAVAKNYAESIRANKVKYVVNLSSIGADVGQGVGPVDALHDFEKMLNAIPGLNVKHLRPSFFYYNLLAQIGLIKQAGFMGANYGSEKILLVHTSDIAKAAIEALLKLNFSGQSVRYIVGDERSGNEIAAVLGKAIGKELQWVEFTDDQQKQGLLQAGVPETHANGYTAMGKSLREGIMQRDVLKNKPSFSSVKLEDFAKEFAAAF